MQTPFGSRALLNDREKKRFRDLVGKEFQLKGG
jgi:hypothetical protein